MSKPPEQPQKRVIYRRFIVKNGKRIFPKKAKCFRIELNE